MLQLLLTHLYHTMIAFIGILFVAAPLVILGVIVSLLSRVKRLEQDMREITNWLAQETAARTADAVSPAVSEQDGESSITRSAVLPSDERSMSEQPALQTPHEPLVRDAKDADSGLIAWVKENWMMKLGALLFLIGIGWFVSYAFAQGWVGPMGRISLGLGAGVLLMLVGYWRFNSAEKHEAGIFMVTGSGVILATMWAAREIYEFFDPFSALLIMASTIVLLALTSIRHDARSLALASLVLGGIAPLLTNTPNVSYVSLFIYLLVVIVGTMWIVFITGWRVMVPTALILVGAYSIAPWVATISSLETNTLLMLAFVSAGVFFYTSTAGLFVQLRTVTNDHAGALYEYVFTAVGVGLFLIGWILSSADTHWQSVLLTLWALAFAIGAFAFARRARSVVPMIVYGAVGAVLLGIALSLELEGPALSIALMLEVFIAITLVVLLVPQVSIVKNTTVLLGLPVLLSLHHIDARAWLDGVLHGDLAALVIVMGGCAWLGFLLHERRTTFDETKQIRTLTGLYITSATIYALVLVWLVLHAALPGNQDSATFITLVVYTIVGVATYFYGLWHHSSWVLRFGAALLLFVVGRLLLVDVWQMALGGRVVTFLGIGLLLLATAFISKSRSIRATHETSHE